MNERTIRGLTDSEIDAVFGAGIKWKCTADCTITIGDPPKCKITCTIEGGS